MTGKSEQILQQIEDYLSNRGKQPGNFEHQSFQTLFQEFSNLHTELEFQHEELKRVQQDLEKTNTQLQAIFMNAPIGFALLDDDFRFILFNKHLHKKLGCPPLLRKDEDIRKLVHPDDQTAFHLFFTNIGIDSRAQKPVCFLKNEGDHIWFEIYATDFSENAAKRKILMVFIDATGEVKAKQSLAKSQKLIENITTHVQDVIIVASLDLQTQYISPSIRQFGYESADLTGVSIFSLLHPDDLPHISETVSRNLATKQDGRAEFRILRQDREYEWVETTGSIVTNSEGHIEQIIFVARSMAERKKHEVELQLAKTELERSNATKDKLFSIIAHDLRSPFVSLMGLSELIADENHAVDLTNMRLMGKNLYSTARNTYQLLEELLEWSRLQQGLIHAHCAIIHLDSLVAELGNLFEDALAQKQLHLEPDLQEESKLLFTDRNLLLAILRNLISNAIKFSLPGSRITLRSYSAGNGSIRLAVQDEGIGIPADLMPLLFSLDERKNRRGTSNERSAGMGLVIANDLAAVLRGSIWAESTEGMGSTFIVELPPMSEN